MIEVSSIVHIVQVGLPVITTTISFLFFLSVVEQYLRKRKPHQLMWAIAMLLFMITAGAEAYSLLIGHWDPLFYKFYYVLTGIQVSFMGGGVLYLFANRKMIRETNSWISLLLFGGMWSFFSMLWYFISKNQIFLLVFVPAVIMTFYGLLSLIFVFLRRDSKFLLDGMQFAHLFILFNVYIFILMVYQAIITPVNVDFLLNSNGHEVSGLAWQFSDTEPRADVRFFSPLFTIPGGIALIGGAFLSYLLWQWGIKKQTGRFSPKTGVFNLYIGFGALVLSMGGAGSGFGLGTLYISEVISVVLMYFGFLESDKITYKKLKSVFTLGWLRNPETPGANL